MGKYVKVSTHSLALVMLFVVQFVKMPFTRQYSYVKYVFIFFLGIYILQNIKVLLKKRYIIINLLLILFCVLVCTFSYVNKPLVHNSNIFFTAVFFCISLFECFLCIEIMIQIVHPSIVVRTIKNCALAEVFIIDIMYFCLFDFFHVIGESYLIGSKFSIAYAHLFAVVTYITYIFFTKRKNYLRFGLLFLLSCFMCIKVDCMTGLVSLGLFVITLFILSKNKGFYKLGINPYFLIVVLILSFLYIFVADLILNIPFVNQFIHTYMDQEGTMESRNAIYKLSLLALSKSPIIGYGYNSSYELGMTLGHFADTQNSILEWIWQAGIVGTTIMITFLSAVFGRISKEKINLYVTLPFLSLFYVYILIGTVEITFSSAFFSFLAFILFFAEKCDKEDNRN